MSDSGREWPSERPISREALMKTIENLTVSNERLLQELEQWKTWGIVEIAVRNPNVASYMDHWEGRALRAEEENAELKGIIAGLQDVASNATWTNARKPTGIHVTSVTPPEQGWLMSFYCSICKETVFLLSPWAIKPKDGDYFRMDEMCASEEYAWKHNMEFAANLRV